jgi:hypothetical protein
MRTRLAAIGGTAALAATTVLVAAPAAEAKPASLKSSYTCATALGDQTMAVTIKLDLPAKVKKGKKVAARPVKMTVVVPESLVAPMRDVLGISALSGSASNIKYRVGKLRVPLKKVTIPKTKVPASGAMTLKAKGVASGFKAPKKKGKLVVSIPKSFTFNASNQNGQPVPSSPFACSVGSGAPTKLGTIKVVK